MHVRYVQGVVSGWGGVGVWGEGGTCGSSEGGGVAREVWGEGGGVG